MLEIFGVAKKEDLLGINLFEHPLANKDLKDRIRTGETVDLSFNYSFDKMVDYYQTPQKGTRALITKIIPLRNHEGKITNYFILVIDNTETQNAQSRIIEFEEFFSLAGDYAKVGYARYDLIKCEGYASDSWYLNVGETKDKALKELFTSCEYIHPEDRGKIEYFLEEARKGVLKKFRENVRINRGDRYTWSCVNILVRDYRPEEGIIELVCINYDITELKEMEEKLIEAKNHAETLDRLKVLFLLT
ncbi:PAS domain-containing protein [Bacteroides sp. CR5/BHMF/2]|nr:PAS domain-containing protein [Bacteroides sp. CR5/BHMF/2]